MRRENTNLLSRPIVSISRYPSGTKMALHQFDSLLSLSIVAHRFIELQAHSLPTNLSGPAQQPSDSQRSHGKLLEGLQEGEKRVHGLS